MSLNQVPVKRKKAEWCDKNTEIMLKVCIEEVNVGNKPHNHFTKLGWANIAEKFNKATNLRYEYKQFRNRWDSLKKEWQLWAKLIGKDTGLGWDGEKKTIAASDEWWEAKIQEDPEVAKFREQGLKFLPEMEFLFKGTIATGFAAYAPSEDSRQYEGFNTRTEETNDNIDDNTDMEVNEPEIDTTTQNTSSAKENGQRKRGREGDKRIGVAAKLSSQLDRIIQTFESSVSAQDPTSITTCVAKLKDLPGLERGSELFYKATKLMKKRANRITFVALEEPELQLGWIKSET